jgi:tRNA pseudouridine55 synthase
MARAGESVELKEREVTIESLSLVSWDDSEPERPIAVVDVACSAGTYVRALARDLGAAVGNAAYLGALRRTAAGSFGEEGAASLDAIRSATADGPQGLVPLLRPVDAGLERFASVELDEPEVDAVAKGQYIRPAAGIPGQGDHYRLVDRTGRLVAIAVPAGGGRLAPDKVLISAGERPVSVGT